MRAAWVSEWGPPESISVVERPDPEPGEGEVVVAVEAAAVNYPDVLIAANRYQVSVPPPFSPGSEFAGSVLAVGEGVGDFKPGDRVQGSAMVGAFAERICARATSLRPVPDAVDIESAASYGVVYGTAYSALRSVAGVQAGDWVVVLGAAGGVGMATVDLAGLLGARVLAAASSDEKLEVCRRRGAEATVNYEQEDLKERIRDLTGGGADIVVDPVGGPYAEAALRSTRWGGRFVTVGFASGEIPRIPLNLVLLKGVVIKGYEMRTHMQHDPDAARRDREELHALYTGGRISPYIGGRFPLEGTGEALRLVAERGAIGKILIEPPAR